MKTIAKSSKRPCPLRIESNFQATRLTGGGSAALPERLHAFGQLRREVFSGVNHRGNIREALIFGLLIGLSAWPIATMIETVLHTLR